uniref:Procollagen C-endopeptidase enhancer 2 n=1 Tax=Equus caballus TaxID=9796 RepID=A0A9L0S491_HORSE
MRGAGAWAPLCLLLAAAQPSRQQPPERPVFACGGILTGESGFIGSEGFPGVYPPNSKCTWKITVPEGKVVVLNFRFIDLESDNLCRYDFVDVYNGHANGQRIGRFCGTFRPGALVSSGNKMMVQMISDANTAGNGFMAMFSAAEPNERGDQYCGGLLERPSGSFTTPNWPDRDYPAGVTCVWHIVAPKNQLVELKFEKFDVERDNYCRYDYVAVFNGGEANDAQRIGKYCGDSPPAPIVSERNELLIQFLSDLSLTADGFIAHYQFRPKKLPATTVPPVTTTFPVTTDLKPTVALCQQKCRRTGTLESNYCSSNFVLAGTVITTITRGGSLHATVSIINIYKEGNLAIQQAGKNMSAKVVVVCKQCPLLRRGVRPPLSLMEVPFRHREEQTADRKPAVSCGRRRLNVSSTDSLEAVYSYIAVKGYFRNGLCEDVKKRFYACNIYSDICFTFKHLLRRVIFFSCIFLNQCLIKYF